MDCDAKEHSAITHVNPTKKRQINVTWIAPKDANLVKTGVKFSYTVVEEKNRFWVGQQSPILEFVATPNAGIVNKAGHLAFVSIIVCFVKKLL